jgi:hypothetical protein
MYGLGIVKGMAVTFKHIVETYLDDFRWMFRGGRYWNPEALDVRQNIIASRAPTTINYPEEKAAHARAVSLCPVPSYGRSAAWTAVGA